MLVHFRKIISANVVNKVNQMMVKKYKRGPLRKHKKKETQKVLEQKNRGKLILDGTCAPIDISYPTDLGILNKARKQTERIIDSLSEQIKGRLDKKPRTYRELAIKDYIVVAKKSRPRHKQRSKAIKRQLQYIKINLSHIQGLIS